LQQITPEDWPRVTIWPIASLEIPDDRLTKAGLTIYCGVVPGLGVVRSSGARLKSGRLVALHRHNDSPCPLNWDVELENTEGLEADINEVLIELAVFESEVFWVSSIYVLPEYEVLRQDDNGNCFAVGKYRFRAIAEHVAGKYTAAGHKQMYWVTRVGPNYEIKRTPDVDLR
jgi:hypothetical protein